jgi:hypothetical protein
VTVFGGTPPYQIYIFNQPNQPHQHPSDFMRPPEINISYNVNQAGTIMLRRFHKILEITAMVIDAKGTFAWGCVWVDLSFLFLFCRSSTYFFLHGGLFQ